MGSRPVFRHAERQAYRPATVGRNALHRDSVLRCVRGDLKRGKLGNPYPRSRLGPAIIPPGPRHYPAWRLGRDFWPVSREFKRYRAPATRPPPVRMREKPGRRRWPGKSAGGPAKSPRATAKIAWGISMGSPAMSGYSQGNCYRGQKKLAPWAGYLVASNMLPPRSCSMGARFTRQDTVFINRSPFGPPSIRGPVSPRWIGPPI